MAIAGRILIIPKGDYDANASYTMLDLVSHNGTSWLARKDATGIEPSEANSEYWQNMFDFDIVNNLTTETEGKALDARQGKALDDKITYLNNTLSIINLVPDDTDFNTLTQDGWYSIYSTINSPTEEKNRWLVRIETARTNELRVTFQTAFFHMGGEYVSPKTRHVYFYLASENWSWSPWV